MRATRIGMALAVVAWATLSITAASAEGMDRSNWSQGDPQPPRAAEGALILYDQINNISSEGYGSQDYETTYDAYDNQAADDFTVPPGQSWTIESVEVAGFYADNGQVCTAGALGPAQAVNVFFYADGGGIPGTEIAVRFGLAPNAGPNFNLDLLTNLTLVPGTYWVSVQSIQNCDSNGQWFWAERTLQSGNPFAWRNPGGGFGGPCGSYSTSPSCVGNDPDLTFRLVGNSYACRGFYANQVGQAMPSTRAYSSLVGTVGGDTLFGTNFPEVIMGLTGNDRINGLGGGDLLCGGPGNDKLKGGGGRDALLGQGGNDILAGQGGKDLHLGGGGSDRCKGGPGNDAGNCEFERE